jgi:hypothetical protein
LKEVVDLEAAEKGNPKVVYLTLKGAVADDAIDWLFITVI